MDLIVLLTKMLLPLASPVVPRLVVVLLRAAMTARRLMAALLWMIIRLAFGA